MKRLMLCLLLVSAVAMAQDTTSKTVRLDVLNGRTNSYTVNGKTIPAGKGILNVLREARQGNEAVLNVFLHSSDTRIRDILNIAAAADKNGGYVEQHFFVKCQSFNKPAWCELKFGKPQPE